MASLARAILAKPGQTWPSRVLPLRALASQALPWLAYACPTTPCQGQPNLAKKGLGGPGPA